MCAGFARPRGRALPDRAGGLDLPARAGFGALGLLRSGRAQSDRDHGAILKDQGVVTEEGQVVTPGDVSTETGPSHMMMRKETPLAMIIQVMSILDKACGFLNLPVFWLNMTCLKTRLFRSPSGPVTTLLIVRDDRKTRYMITEDE